MGWGYQYFQGTKIRVPRKNSTNELPTRRVKDSPSSFFCPTSRSIQESEGLYKISYLQGQWKYGKANKAVESARAGLLPQKGDVRNSRKEKKRKGKDQGRQEGGPSEGRVPSILNQEFLFFGSRVSGFRNDPSRFKYRLLQDQLYEEAICKRSTGNELLNAAKAVP